MTDFFRVQRSLGSDGSHCEVVRPMWITRCDSVCITRVKEVGPGGTARNLRETHGTIRNPATYQPQHTTYHLSSLVRFFHCHSLASLLLSYSVTNFLLSLFQISSCPLFFSFLTVTHRVSSYPQISQEMRENCILPFLCFIFSKEEIG